ncbi:MAG TPA: hypothetical protein VLF43_03615 [Candidatus Saccharimonadales bacterium]|nr:hypothetical protein [Candidatus Saccharimonadales bacterium]
MAFENLQLNLLLAHNATILPDSSTGYAPIELPSAAMGRTPRAEVTDSHLGSVKQGDQKVDFYSVELGEPIDLPDPKEGVHNIVSKLTIHAALRAGRPIDDLLFLYGDIRGSDENGRDKFFGVKGLGRPVVRKHVEQDLKMPDGDIDTQVTNASPYPIKLYGPGTPNRIAPDHKTIAVMPTAPREKQLQVSYAEELDRDLSSRLGLPVYNTEAVGVRGYDPASSANPETFRVVNFNVAVCLGAEAVAGGLVILTQSVRNKDTNTILGGRAYGMFGDSVLNTYKI